MKRSPAAAFWLSLLPGVGHLYLGQFTKGLVFPLVLAGIINAIDRGAGGLGILIPVFWIAVMLDAHRSAQELNVAIDRGVLPPVGMNYQLGKWWGWVLIVLGVLFTLTNFNWINLDWVFNLWPLGLIAVGIYVLRRPASPPLPPPSAPPPPETESTMDSEEPEVVQEPIEEDPMPSADDLMTGNVDETDHSESEDPQGV